MRSALSFSLLHGDGIHKEGAAAEFLEHSNEEQQHADRIAERIKQLGGKPELNPAVIAQTSHSEYVEGTSLEDMLREDLVAERIAIQTYREMIAFFGEKDSTTRRLMEEILAVEEEHADDIADLLFAVEPDNVENRRTSTLKRRFPEIESRRIGQRLDRPLKRMLVAEAGFEPAVFGISARDFIQLNYSARLIWILDFRFKNESGWSKLPAALLFSSINEPRLQSLLHRLRLKVVHEQILSPFRTVLGVVTEQHVVEPQPQQLLRRQQRHSRLFRRAVAFALVALDTGRNEIVRRALAALSSRQNVVERQVLGMLMLAAVLAAIAVANVDAGTLHRGLAIVAADMNIMPKPHNRRHRKDRRGRMKDIVAVVFLDKNGTAKPQANGPGDADRPERLVREIQQ